MHILPLDVGLYIFILAGFLGYHVITRVPPLLHTPLMSATNAMSGISLIGSLVVAGSDHGPLSNAFGFVAVTCSSTNGVGGLLIPDRMLRMFKPTGAPGAPARTRRSWAAAAVLVAAAALGALLFAAGEAGTEPSRADLGQALKLSYIVSAALFILGLKGLSHPRHARQG